MENLLNHNRLNSTSTNCDWQAQILKEQYGALTLSGVTFELGKENDLLFRLGILLNKSPYQIIRMLKELRPM